MYREDETFQKTIYIEKKNHVEIERRRKIMKRSYNAEVNHILERHFQNISRWETEAFASLPPHPRDKPLDV